MQLQRNEILTGLLVLVTVAILAAVLILLGAPGLFRPLVTYKIYFDNAAGIKLGAPVLLAGRKIGQVDKLYSPVSKDEEARAQAAAHAANPVAPGASPTPTPPGLKITYEARVDVRVDKDALVYRNAKARMTTLGLLGETIIDITQGTDSAGRASDGELFAGERVPDFGEAIAQMLVIIQPVATEATATLKQLQTTADNLSHITADNSQLNMSLAQFRTFAENLTNLTARDSSISTALKNVETISGNLTKLSTDLTTNNNIQITLQNFRDSSEKLQTLMGSVQHLGPDLNAIGANVKDMTETLKTQPWRLVYPTTKKYPNEKPEAEITVRKSTKARKEVTPDRSR